MSVKKVLKFCIMFCFLVSFSVTLVHAKSGDVIGKVYSSDILATVNGYPIQSYNIGGKMLISAEELKNYGFSVWYDDSTRRMDVTIWDGKVSESALNANIPRGKTGRIVGTLYETNIVVLVNGIEAKSYAINDKIFVCLEELGDLTNSPNAEYGYSKYYMKCEWDSKNRVISLNTLIDNTNDFTNSRIYKEYGYGLYVTRSENSSECFIEFNDSYFNSIISSEFFGVVDKMFPLRLRYEGKDTDFIVGYMIPLHGSIQWYFFIDVLEQAFDDGYYHAVTHDERIKQIINSRINWSDPYERLESDICTVIYYEQHGLPHGYSNYVLIFVYMDGSYKRVMNLPLKDLALSDDGTKLTYLSIMSGKTYEVDLETAEITPLK